MEEPLGVVKVNVLRLLSPYVHGIEKIVGSPFPFHGFNGPVPHTMFRVAIFDVGKFLFEICLPDQVRIVDFDSVFLNFALHV